MSAGRILVVKLSSLGDVVHSMPAVQDMRAALPNARIDWVVERGFAPLVRRCQGVGSVIECELRRWRKAPFTAQTLGEWRIFRTELQSSGYDAIIDLQGLAKSALVAGLARKTPGGGKRYALANQTEGSSYEAPTRWVADEAIAVEPHIHAVQRSRELCAKALGYAVPAGVKYGLAGMPPSRAQGGATVALVHGTSRDDKGWPESHWRELGLRLIEAGHSIALPHGNDAERARSERIALALGPKAAVWPAMDLGAMVDRLSACAGVVGVDSGLSHIAVALGLPHVQLYNFNTAWRTGPLDNDRQLAIYGQPAPTVDAVWDAWRKVAA